MNKKETKAYNSMLDKAVGDICTSISVRSINITHEVYKELLRRVHDATGQLLADFEEREAKYDSK